MDLKSLGQTVAKFAPMLGKLIPIPGVGIAIDLLASAFGCEPEASIVSQAIAADPEAGVKIAQIEADNRGLLQRQLLGAETSRIQAVNTTMQEESKSEHWMQWAWRPFNGFLFGITLFCVYALPALLNGFAPLFVSPDVAINIATGISSVVTGSGWTTVSVQGVPEFVFMAWGSILGVSAWKRGDMKTKIASVFKGRG